MFSDLHTQPFDKIEGYEDIKDIVRRALDSEENYNLLFTGPTASAKTMFLNGIMEMKKDAVYFDGANTTSRILDVLEQERPKIICIDELDKMSRQFQNQLLNFMESGRVKVDQMKRRYDFEIKGVKIFGSCNDIKRLSAPLQSRFRRLFLSIYTEDQFLEVSVKVLPKLPISISRYIGAKVWENQGDIHEVISIGKLVLKSDGLQEIEQIIRSLR
jgi:AAA+ superfamily predicted ATPase